MIILPEVMFYIPVNYAIRFSGPVTAFTARCVWYGVGARSICQADPLAGYPFAGCTNTFSVLAR
jgi:hypothetical protein